MSFDYCIEIGCMHTMIYKKNAGILLKEKSAVLFEERKSKRFLLEVGAAAINSFSKNDPFHNLVFPIKDGVVADLDAATLMLKEFFKKIEEKSFFKNSRVVLSLSSGLSEKEQRVYKNILYTLNISRVVIVPSILLAYIKMKENINIDTYLLLNIGHGLVNIGIVAGANILFAGSVDAGANVLDGAIKEHFLQNHKVLLNDSHINTIKRDITTLHTNDIRSTTLSGISFAGKNKLQVSSKEIYPIAVAYFSQIVESVRKVLSTCSLETVQQIRKNGVLTCGGLANVTGVEKFLSSRLNLKVFVDSEPEHTSILGGGKLIEDEQLTNRILFKT